MKVSISWFVSYFLFFSFVFFIISGIILSIANLPYPIAMISGESMKPILCNGDAVIWYPEKLESIQVNDIIAYRSYAYEGKIIIHRVINVYGKPPYLYIETKGDNNDASDQAGGIERYIDTSNYLGKVPGKETIFKIPNYVNVVYLGSQVIDKLKELTYEKPALGWYYFIILLTIMILITIVYILAKKPTTPESIEEVIYGEEKIDLRRIFIYTLIAIVIITLISNTFAYSTITLSVGVHRNAESADISINNAVPESTSNYSYNLDNPNIFPLKAVIFSEGNIYVYSEKLVYMLNPNTAFTTELYVFVPKNLKKGVYNQNIYCYSSPFWYLIPDSIINSIINISPIGGIYLLNILISLFISCIVILFLVAIDKFVYRIELFHTSYHAKRMLIKPTKPELIITKNTEKKFLDISYVDINLKSVILASIIVTPIVVIIHLIPALFIGSFFAGILSYIFGERFKPGIISAGICSGVFITLFYCIIKSINFIPVATIMFSFLLYIYAMLLILLILLLLPMAILSYIGAVTIRKIILKFKPEIQFTDISEL